MVALLHHAAANVAYRPSRRFRQKWIYIGSTLALHVFMTVWVNDIGDISAKFTFGTTTIYPGQDGRFIVVNPPHGQ
ncbi:hypothetical protein ACLECW_04335, partial [Lonsdalea quercina]